MSHKILSHFGLENENAGSFDGKWLADSQAALLQSVSPTDGATIASVRVSSEAQYEQVVERARETFKRWRMYPAPQRGEVVRKLAEQFRLHKRELGILISLEMGKILPEAEGEVQEVIDIADFAVGLSRQLYGKTMHSERPQHRMYEQWHPLGLVGTITAFNFPAAVWAWNAMIAAVCGDVVVWKPSELTPLTANAIIRLTQKVTEEAGFPGLFTLITGEDASLGKKMAADSRFPLISATGSCRMGHSVAETVGKRLGRSLLELGGNNAMIIMEDADLELAKRAVVFGAVGTAGQRCTSTRRVLIARDLEQQFVQDLKQAYAQVRIGDPLTEGTLMGPLISADAVTSYLGAIERIKNEGGEIVCGGNVCTDMPSELFVEPTIVRMKEQTPIVLEETFAPILYVMPIDSLDHAIELHNAVPQGLSSAIFTSNVRSAEQFLSAVGSDCGIANVNIGTSGAEIGGAFGGEKETGGGREAGSDAWKAYMRRQTNTINWSTELPLAQGITFG